jgi:hypothetical protein
VQTGSPVGTGTSGSPLLDTNAPIQTSPLS